MGGSRALAQGWPLIAGQLAASAPVAPILGALSISPNTGTIGQAYSGTISGATAGSTIMLDTLTVSGTGTTRSVTGTLSGSPGAWSATETLAGATGSPRTTTGVLTVSAAGQTVTVTGTPQVGQTLTASESSNWSVGGVARNFLAASATYKPVPGDVGKTITATGATSGTTSAATAVVTNAALPAVTPPLAYGVRMTAIGDSIVQQNVAGVARSGDATQGGVHGGASGEISQMLTFEARVNALNWYDNTKGTSTNRFTNGCIQGLNGNTSQQSADRFDTDVTPLNHDITIIAVGTNDLGSPSTITSNISAMVTKRRNAGKACIVATVRPVSPAGDTTRPKAQIQAANDAIRSYVAGLASDRVVLWDVYKQYDRGDGFGYPSDYADGQLHPGDFGAELGAWGLDPTTPAPDSLAFAIRKLVGAGDVYADAMAASTNFLTAPTMTGSTAQTGTGFSGVRPTNWTWQGVGTLASTVACSLEANADTGGQSAVATITPGGTASFERMLFQPTAFATPSGLAGQWVRFFAEVETDGCPWVSSPLAAIIEYDSGTSKQISRTILPAGTYPGMRPVPHRRRIMTDPLLMDATAATQILVNVQIAWQPNGATGTAVVKIRRVWAAIIPNPKTAWGQ